MTTADEPRRFIPSVDKLLGAPELAHAVASYPRWAVLQEVRAVIEEVRNGTIPIVTDAALRAPWLASLAQEAARRAVAVSQYSLRRVVNATGVVLHTNLGRAPLAPAAIEHVVAVARHYANLELDLDTGERGHRYDHVRELICALTGAEDAIAVNNNAAAVLLCLSALAAGKQVVVSRGELVEIGGSFRIPDIMVHSGCRLVEVGTTNRTRLSDYERAITPETALLLKVHPSNFRVVGFTSSVEVDELVPLARQHGIAVMNDLGAGCLVELRDLGLPHEPTVQEAVKQGADVVTFSGDKLLGGPQVGVIAGKRAVIERLETHPLLRALRIDKLTLAAFEATLRIYRDAKDPIAELPCLRMLRTDAATLQHRAGAFAARLAAQLTEATGVSVVAGSSQVGAGSAPGVDVPTFLVAVRPTGVEVAAIDARLRALSPAVMVRVHGGDVLIDLRTVDEDEEVIVLESLMNALRRPG
jgi:L-seryl-tRNA(Ser) seleniumtransferase